MCLLLLLMPVSFLFQGSLLRLSPLQIPFLAHSQYNISDFAVGLEEESLFCPVRVLHI